jgi:hypothetical protein
MLVRHDVTQVSVSGTSEEHQGYNDGHKRRRSKIIPSKIADQESIEGNTRVLFPNGDMNNKRIEVPNNARGQNKDEEKRQLSTPQGLRVSIFG